MPILSRVDDVETETLTISALSESQKEGTASKFFLVLPRYQRGVVWSASQKKKLIDSISQGFPVGSLLGFNRGEFKVSSSGREDRPVIELVDGLQRTNTVVEFMREPLKFFGVDTLFSHDEIMHLSSFLFEEPADENHDQVRRVLDQWLGETKVTKRTSGFSNAKLLEVLLGRTGSSGVSDERKQQLINFLDEKLDATEEVIGQVADVKVPIVIYRGSEDNIPEIFERINSQGIKLSKYEKFAASWIHYNTVIKNQDVRQHIEAKYQSLRNRGFEITDLPETGAIPEDEFNLFEYMFGLGKDLSNKFPYLFPPSTDLEDAPSHAFVLSTIAMGLKIADMGSLAKVCQQRYRNQAGHIDLSDFESALRSACADAESIIRPILKVRLNSQQATDCFQPHSANQINSIVVRILLETHDRDSWKKKGSIKASHKRSLLAHYVLDIIQGSWAGSGDNRLFEMCWTGEGESAEVSSTFITPVPRKTMLEALGFWHESQLGKRQKSRSNIPTDAKLLLRLMYSRILSVYQDESTVFELEHLYPVADLASRIKELNVEGWPISALGNLCLLTSELNKIKQESYIGDYIAKNPISAEEDRETRSLVGEPGIEAIVRNPELTLSEYLEFCNLRFAWQRDQILSNLELT